MANTTTSPNMNLPVPTVSVDPGPDWATNVVSCLGGIDSHNHSTGQGVPINPDGINLNADLPFNGNNATLLRTSRYSSQSAPLSTSGTADLNCVYVVSGELYYNDGAGDQVKITAGGSVNAGSGSISGLPSGTAGASYGGGAFTFVSATNTPATLNIGPVAFGAQVANPKTVTVAASASQPTNYSLTWPLAAPANHQTLVSDGSGNLSWSLGLLPIGSVVATFPNLTGAYSCVATTVADAFGFVLAGGQVLADATSPMNGQTIPLINDSLFLLGSGTSGSTGGNENVTLSTANLAAHTHNYNHTHGNTFALGGTTTFSATGHTHNFAHDHQWGYTTGVSSALYTVTTPSYTIVGFTNSTSGVSSAVTIQSLNGAGANPVWGPASGANPYYTSGVLDAPSGSGASATTNASGSTGTVSLSGSVTPIVSDTGSTGSGTSFSILPPYVTCIYVMRVK